LKIDAHAHIMPPDIAAREARFRERDPYFKLLTDSPSNRYATAEDVIAHLDEYGFDKAVVCGWAFRDAGLCRETNDYVIDAVARHPQRLIGLACLQPVDPGLEGEIERCVSAGLSGVGELMPQGQGFRLDDPGDMGPLAGLLRELDLPLLVHTNEPVGHQYPGKTQTSVKQAAAFAAANPDLRIVFAHWGGGLFFYELMPELRTAFQNVYYDTAASPFLYEAGVYEAVAACGVAHKVLLATDYPLLPLGRYLRQLEATSLTQEQLKLIMGQNAASVFKQ